MKTKSDEKSISDQDQDIKKIKLILRDFIIDCEKEGIINGRCKSSVLSHFIEDWVLDNIKINE